MFLRSQEHTRKQAKNKLSVRCFLAGLASLHNNCPISDSERTFLKLRKNEMQEGEFACLFSNQTVLR